MTDGRWSGEAISSEGALEATFDCAVRALGDAGLKLADVRSFAVCVGPGSILGIRVSALAARTWAALRPCPILVWQSLSALAHAARDEGVPPPFIVAQESRLRRWNRVLVGPDGACSAIAEVAAEDLRASGQVIVSDCPAASELFPKTRGVAQPWARLPRLFQTSDLLQAQDKPEALNPAADFAAWSGDRHRARA